MNCFFQMVSDRSRISHGYSILRQGLHHRDDIQFLWPALSDPKRGSVLCKHPIGALYLSREKETWSRVEKRSSQSGHSICSARAGSDHGYPKPVGRFGVVLRRDRTCLLMLVTDEFEALTARKGVIEVHGSAAGHDKNMFYAEIGNESDNVIGKLHCF